MTSLAGRWLPLCLPSASSETRYFADSVDKAVPSTRASSTASLSGCAHTVHLRGIVAPGRRFVVFQHLRGLLVLRDEGLQRASVTGGLVLVVAPPGFQLLSLLLGFVYASGDSPELLRGPLALIPDALFMAAGYEDVQLTFDFLSACYVH